MLKAPKSPKYFTRGPPISRPCLSATFSASGDCRPLSSHTLLIFTLGLLNRQTSAFNFLRFQLCISYPNTQLDLCNPQILRFHANVDNADFSQRLNLPDSESHHSASHGERSKRQSTPINPTCSSSFCGRGSGCCRRSSVLRATGSCSGRVTVSATVRSRGRFGGRSRSRVGGGAGRRIAQRCACSAGLDGRSNDCRGRCSVSITAVNHELHLTYRQRHQHRNKRWKRRSWLPCSCCYILH